ncbi:Cohesin subunit psc3 [Golovinomyces cichoracearum]|uniref:Cohesin subunit psc3 n=1 Tax=Golovinomyces cichoracearum TaxID=62708 RepID=A0A420J8F9_9PEZI|nr:Cohesin subunit psc3 [Golovinomyces cichoracearum]
MDSSNTGTTDSSAITPRRRSGRTVKPPQKFALVVIPTRVKNVSTKRKRKLEDERGSSDLEENENHNDDHTSEKSADGVESKVRMRQRKNRSAAKKSKVNGRFNPTSSQTVESHTRPPQKSTARVAIPDKDVRGLYEALAELFSSVDRPQDVAAQWLQRYYDDGRQALAELVNLVLRCSGCNIEVTVDDIDDVDNVDGRLVDVQNEFQMQNITEYPLIARARTNQTFRVLLTNFFDKFVEVLHESGVLYEEVILLENIHQWIAALSSSTTRPFRHTATLVALTMTSARCRIAHTEIEKAAKVHRQLENEAKSKKPNKARLADFQRRVNKINERKAMIEGQIQDYFDTVYVHRYRDIDPKIRAECVEALGTWIVSLESYFFDGQYLRYMGWMLSDTHGPMRQSVVMQLQRIMKNVNHGGIRHFIDRFRPRLIEMATRDSEPSVRSQTVELLTLIRNAEMLEPEDSETVGSLIFDAEPRVRKAVVNFFITNVNNLYEIRRQDIYGEEALERTSNLSEEDATDSPRSSWIKYKCLSEILVEYDALDQAEIPSQSKTSKILRIAGSESRFSLAAQALFEKMPELREWEILAEYLLYDHTSKSIASESESEHLFLEAVRPSESEEIILLEILNAVVKLYFQNFEETSRDKKKQTRVDLLEAREVAAFHLANLIIRLLKKYGADPKTVKIVLRLARFLDLESFHDEIQQSSSLCSRLLDEICAQLRSHADIDVLKEASLALLHARSYEEIEEITNSKIHSLWEESINTLQKINQAGEISIRGGSLSEKLLTELSHNLTRIEQLSSISNSVDFMEGYLNKEEPCPITLIFDIIARGELVEGNIANDSLEDITVKSAIRSGLFYFMWKTRSLATLSSNAQTVTENDIDQLRERQEIFTANLIASFSSRAELDEVRLLGAGTLADLYVTFFTTLGVGIERNNENVLTDTLNESLTSLVKNVGTNVQQELALIFSELERQYAKKSKKKLNAPGDDEAPEDLDSETDEENEDEVNDLERYTEILAAEEQLCQFTGKLCLAILARVIDSSGPHQGKLRSRLLRNRNLLGPNFKEVVAFLDEPKSKNNRKLLKDNDRNIQDSDRKKKPQKKIAKNFNSDDEDAETIGEELQQEEAVDPFADDNIEGEEQEHEIEDEVEEEEREREEEEEEGKENEELSGSNEDNDTIMGD